MRELGIRKIHGANVNQLIVLMLREYTVLIVLALVVAFPLAFYLSEQWLSNFVYRATLGPGVFIFAGMATILIAIITVSFKSIQAASANPVNTLRDN